MMLARVIKEIFQAKSQGDPAALDVAPDDRRRVLNVGGGSKTIPIPDYYKDWNHLLLDINPKGAPDIVCDARELTSLPAEAFDAIYCSHNLEHYFRHDGAKVLKGFLHVLKPDGFADIRVPDIRAVIERFLATGMDIHDILYESPAGPISVHDVIYGWGKQIESSGVDYYAHKTGFTRSSLDAALSAAGFSNVFLLERPDRFEIAALAFKTAPTDWQRKLFDL